MKRALIFSVVMILKACQPKKNSVNPNGSLGTTKITLEEIWNDAFSTAKMNALNPSIGDHYTLLNQDGDGNSRVDQYSYKNLSKTATLVDGKKIKKFHRFESYHFNENESKVILGNALQKIYRRSVKGTYHVFFVDSQKMRLIGKGIREPTFSPDGNKVAYAKANNLFILDLVNGKTTQITQDGKNNSIINGTTDWVYEEEFGFVRAFQWSNDSNFVAFLRFDESDVKEFSMDITGKDSYPSQYVFKYPKAGEDNAKVSLHLYDLSEKSTKEIALGTYEYIPRIQWSNKKNVLVASTLNRHQNLLKLHKVDALTKETTLLLIEKDEAYVEVRDDLTFLADHSFIWTSEKDGYNHLYHYHFDGTPIHQVTKGNWEVTRYYGYDEKKKTIYYQSTENGTINRGIYSIGLNGSNKKLLSYPTGTNSASFSKNFNYFINLHSSAETPPSYSLYTSKGKRLKVILENTELKEKLSSYAISPKEFSTLRINGYDLNMWMIKPLNFDQTKTYPMLLFQYSGPGSQQVANRWNGTNDYWHQLLAQEGIIVACVDGRGTGLKGRDFKKITQKQLGRFEVEDQIAAAKKLARRSYIDKNKIGIWGWSYGGFMSTNCLLKGNDIFTTAIAVAPVTSWRFYDTVYTERYMQTPQENPRGYDDNSPINYVEKLKGTYLLVHGTADDNVHVQNTMRMIDALVEANKSFELALYPDKAHGISKGKNTRLHLYEKMTDFIQKNLTSD